MDIVKVFPKSNKFDHDKLQLVDLKNNFSEPL